MFLIIFSLYLNLLCNSDFCLYCFSSYSVDTNSVVTKPNIETILKIGLIQ